MYMITQLYGIICWCIRFGVHSGFCCGGTANLLRGQILRLLVKARASSLPLNGFVLIAFESMPASGPNQQSPPHPHPVKQDGLDLGVFIVLSLSLTTFLLHADCFQMEENTREDHFIFEYNPPEFPVPRCDWILSKETDRVRHSCYGMDCFGTLCTDTLKFIVFKVQQNELLRFIH